MKKKPLKGSGKQGQKGKAKPKARGKARGRCMNLVRVRRNRKRVMKRLVNRGLKRRLLIQLFWVLSVPLDSVSLTLCVRLGMRSSRMKARRCMIWDQILSRTVCLRRLMKVPWIMMLVFHVMVCRGKATRGDDRTSDVVFQNGSFGLIGSKYVPKGDVSCLEDRIQRHCFVGICIEKWFISDSFRRNCERWSTVFCSEWD